MPVRWLVAALALCACSRVVAAPLPPDAAILPQGETADLLQQCSRTTPEAGEAAWSPSADDIAALEAALPAALAAQGRSNGRDHARAPQGWRRQYVGVIRGGRRFVYGNFFPADIGSYGADPEQWRRAPVIVCDGGASFFGVEFDVEAGLFTHFGFNGSA